MIDIDRKTAERMLADTEHSQPLPMPPNVLELLDGIEFPVTKIELIEFASDRGASEEVLDELQAMPDRTYYNLRQLDRYAGTIEHQPGEENLFSSEESHDLPDENDRALTELYGSGRV